jgi:hypothetical protein
LRHYRCGWYKTVVGSVDLEILARSHIASRVKSK